MAAALSGDVWLAAAGAALYSVGQTVAIAAAGALLCRFRLKNPRASVGDLTQMTVWFFGPCLTISQLPATVDLPTLLQLWRLPFFSLIIVVAGCGVGAAAARVIDPAGQFGPLIISCTGVGNALALPLSMAQALALNVPWIAAGGQAELVSYVFVYTVTDSAVLFGPIYFLLGSGPGYHLGQQEVAPPLGGPALHSPLPSADDRAVGNDEDDDDEDDDYDDAEQLLEARPSAGGGTTCVRREPAAAAAAAPAAGPAPSGLVRMAKGLANPMLGAVTLAILTAVVEPARVAFVGSPLHGTMAIAGGATTPLMLAARPSPHHHRIRRPPTKPQTRLNVLLAVQLAPGWRCRGQRRRQRRAGAVAGGAAGWCRCVWQRGSSCCGWW
jgi:predicted permease